MSDQHPDPGRPAAPPGGPVYGAQPPSYGQVHQPPTYGAAPPGPPPGDYQPPWAGPVPSMPAPAATYAPGPAQQRPLRHDYTRWIRRVGAYLIDFAPNILAAAVSTVAYVLFLTQLLRATTPDAAPPSYGPAIVWGVVALVLSLAALGWEIYNRWITAGRTGQSLGKRLLKMILIGEDTGQPIGPLNAFVRDLVHILDGFAYVGYLWPLWDDKRQTFADMIMKTIVVDLPPGVDAPVSGNRPG